MSMVSIFKIFPKLMSQYVSVQIRKKRSPSFLFVAISSLEVEYLPRSMGENANMNRKTKDTLISRVE